MVQKVTACSPLRSKVSTLYGMRGNQGLEATGGQKPRIGRLQAPPSERLWTSSEARSGVLAPRGSVRDALEQGHSSPPALVVDNVNFGSLPLVACSPELSMSSVLSPTSPEVPFSPAALHSPMTRAAAHTTGPCDDEFREGGLDLPRRHAI